MVASTLQQEIQVSLGWGDRSVEAEQGGGDKDEGGGHSLAGVRANGDGHLAVAHFSCCQALEVGGREGVQHAVRLAPGWPCRRPRGRRRASTQLAQGGVAAPVAEGQLHACLLCHHRRLAGKRPHAALGEGAGRHVGAKRKAVGGVGWYGRDGGGRGGSWLRQQRLHLALQQGGAVNSKVRGYERAEAGLRA